MPSPNVLIAFYSRTAVTEGLALAVAEGARAEGAEVRLRRARELVPAELMASMPGWSEQAAAMNAKYPAPTEADAEWADAIIFGGPTRFGAVCSELKAYIDGLGRDFDPDEFLRNMAGYVGLGAGVEYAVGLHRYPMS